MIWNNVPIYLKNVYWIIKRLYNRKFGESLDNNSKRPIKCLPWNNHPCQTTTELVDRNSDETLIHLLLVLANMVKVVTFLMIHMLEFLVSNNEWKSI